MMSKRPSASVWYMSKGKRTKKDIAIITMTIIAIIVFVIFIWNIIFGLVQTNRYHRFVDEFTSSVNTSYRSGGIEVNRGDETYRLDKQRFSSIYMQIVGAGMGKPQENPPEGAELYLLKFSDGSEMSLCETEITEESRQNDQGIYISYTNPAGEVYTYDTDIIVPSQFFVYLQS